MGAEKSHPAFEPRESSQKVAAEALWARCSPVGKGVKFIKELDGPESFEMVPLGTICSQSADCTGHDKAGL